MGSFCAATGGQIALRQVNKYSPREAVIERQCEYHLKASNEEKFRLAYPEAPHPTNETRSSAALRGGVAQILQETARIRKSW
jgi:hypothetical protein